ncbi:hypothetical protein HF521_003200 [Silurus meridionalis]|uniref:Gamma-secretase subunit PEN-2 n=2 Tax=Silurus TaxID=94992 RepID=A0A8T0B6V4_SILME|nr:hypothetical protein HF521_003200 [Silurus meridionalis]
MHCTASLRHDHPLDAEADVSSFFVSEPFHTSKSRFFDQLVPHSSPQPEESMNLERVSNEEKLNLCRKYYLGGFAFLPFLWLVNVVWFFKEAFVKPAYTEQPQIKIYVKRSALGLMLWVAVLTTWITIFQHFRAQWGEVADYLSFTIPLGTP